MTARGYVFVGEKRSRRAIALGVHWEDGRLAARTLQDALVASGLDPREQLYANVFLDGDGHTVDPLAVTRLRRLAEAGHRIVALGRLVQRALTRAGIPHLQLTHPAARGAIRRKSTYQAHVRAVLTSHHPEVA